MYFSNQILIRPFDSLDTDEINMSEENSTDASDAGKVRSMANALQENKMDGSGQVNESIIKIGT